MGLSYSMSNFVSANLFYQNEKHQFHLGGGMQIPDTRGKTLTDPSGHGAIIENSSSYYWSVDAGYAYIPIEHIPVRAVLSVGRRVNYTNYLDSGFTDGGFHTIDSKALAFGVGFDLGYNFMNLFELYAGYHSLWKLYLGIRVPIPDFL